MVRPQTVVRRLVFAALAIIYVRELFIDVIDVDSAQYAHISLEMFQAGHVLDVHNRGANYLDKPPLTFWLAALSYAVFGVSAWAYKLPSLLFALLAILSTHRLTRLYYSERLADTAALIFATSLAVFLWTNDVRTDAILTGAVMLAVWQLALYRERGGVQHFVLGFVAIGLALLAKGPIGVVVPAAAIGGDAILKRQWRWLLSPRWIIGAVISLVVLLPMLIGLYRQFGAEGPRFFFWTQSFGRITGSNSWRDGTTPLFFTHTVLWELLPWTPLFLAGLFTLRPRIMPETVSLFGFVVPFVALSAAHYKLPHYLLVILPFAAILAARAVERAVEEPRSIRFRTLFGLQLLVVITVWGLCLWLSVVAFPLQSRVIGGVLTLLGGATVVLLLRRGTPWSRLMLPSLATSLGLATMLAFHFFPALLQYEGSLGAARFVDAKGIPTDHVATLHAHAYSFDFFLRRSIPEIGDVRNVTAVGLAGTWVFTNDAGKSELAANGLCRTETAAFRNYPISRLTPRFLNPETRPSVLETLHLLRCP